MEKPGGMLVTTLLPSVWVVFDVTWFEIVDLTLLYKRKK